MILVDEPGPDRVCGEGRTTHRGDTGNNTHVAVSSGLSEGQEVALQVPPPAASIH
jgi:hypothetical protein